MGQAGANGVSDPIRHVVVLMLENRSFDQMLGALTDHFPALDGVNQQYPPRTNVDDDGKVYQQLPNAAPVIRLDPHHDLQSVLRQIGADPARPGPDPRRAGWLRLIEAIRHSDPLGWAAKLLKARGSRERLRTMGAATFQGHFVREFARAYPDASSEERQQVMSYFGIDHLPPLHAIGRQFTVCDRWFSSVPGPTWANRFFFHCGTTLGTTWMPERVSDIKSGSLFDQETLYDSLTAAGRTWRIYFHDFPQTLALSRLWSKSSRLKFSVIDEFERDVQCAEQFPDFVFIEPQYMGEDANDDHPPHDSMRAQALIARVYNGLRSNPSIWESTLFVIIYDEHGGFFDHVEPPATICPDGNQAEYSFNQLGLRVPALLVSPWVDAAVWSEQLDHTSVGKYLCDKWGLKPLGRRMEQATSVAGAIRMHRGARADTPGALQSPAIVPMLSSSIGDERTEMNENQRALLALANYLDPAPPPRSAKRGVATEAFEASPDEVRAKAIRFIQG